MSSYIITACDTIRLLTKSFAQLILSSISIKDFAGVDISREERIQKCKLCHAKFLEIQSCLRELGHMPGKIGSTAQDTLTELGVFA